MMFLADRRAGSKRSKTQTSLFHGISPSAPDRACLLWLEYVLSPMSFFPGKGKEQVCFVLRERSREGLYLLRLVGSKLAAYSLFHTWLTRALPDPLE